MFECFVTHTDTHFPPGPLCAYLGLCTVLLCLSLLLLDDNSLSQMSHLNLSTLIVLFPLSTVLVCLFLLVLVVKPLPHIEQ